MPNIEQTCISLQTKSREKLLMPPTNMDVFSGTRKTGTLSKVALGIFVSRRGAGLVVNCTILDQENRVRIRTCVPALPPRQRLPCLFQKSCQKLLPNASSGQSRRQNRSRRAFRQLRCQSLLCGCFIAFCFVQVRRQCPGDKAVAL